MRCAVFLHVFRSLQLILYLAFNSGRVGGIGGVVAPYMVPLGFLRGPSHTTINTLQAIVSFSFQ